MHFYANVTETYIEVRIGTHTRTSWIVPILTCAKENDKKACERKEWDYGNSTRARVYYIILIHKSYNV